MWKNVMTGIQTTEMDALQLVGWKLQTVTSVVEATLPVKALALLGALIVRLAFLDWNVNSYAQKQLLT